MAKVKEEWKKNEERDAPLQKKGVKAAAKIVKAVAKKKLKKKGVKAAAKIVKAVAKAVAKNGNGKIEKKKLKRGVLRKHSCMFTRMVKRTNVFFEVEVQHIGDGKGAFFVGKKQFASLTLAFLSQVEKEGIPWGKFDSGNHASYDSWHNQAGETLGQWLVKMNHKGKGGKEGK